MNIKEFLSYCMCPMCQSDLTLAQDDTVIQCPQHHQFPLMNNRIPVLLPDKEISKSPEALHSNQGTSQSFSTQWQMVKEGDTIWGWDKDKMIEIFLKNTGLKVEDIPGKLILDLGCGHGKYCLFLAELGARVIGFDISNGFIGIESQLDEELKERINFVQGDVFHFPLKENIVDFVWCSGVLHHTPDTRKSFDNVNNVVSRGGHFYMWLYKNVYYTPALITLRKLTTKLPEAILVPLCYLGAPFFALTKALLTLFKRNYRTFEKKSLRENALSIHDTIAPPYRWHHEKEEVIQWYQQANFRNIVVSEDGALGFGVVGEKY